MKYKSKCFTGDEEGVFDIPDDAIVFDLTNEEGLTLNSSNLVVRALVPVKEAD